MEDIKDVSLEGLQSSQYIKPMRLKYTQDGRAKFWDLVICHNAVYIVLFNVDRKKLVFVKQFRPTVYFASVRRNLDMDKPKPGVPINSSSTPASDGVTIELCAGIIDKPALKAQEIAREEILEECGYDVPLSKVEAVQTCLAAVGISGERMTLFYAEVEDSMKRSGSGGGVAEEGEMIETVEMSLDEAREFVYSESVRTTPPTLYGIMWFMMTKAPKHESVVETSAATTEQEPSEKTAEVEKS